MAHFVVETTPEEQDKVLAVLRQVEGKTVPVSQIAKLAGLSQSRTRYVIIDLVDAGLVQKVPTKQFNKHYMRYSYVIL